MRREARWTLGLATLAVLGLSLGLPSYQGALPRWLSVGSALAVAISLGGVSWGRDRRRWLRIERLVVAAVAVVILAAEVTKLATLIALIISHDPRSSGIVLLSSSVAIWCNNIFAFSLIYWQVDRGGPGARENTARETDWRFFEEGDEEATKAGWRPGYVDYLYLAFSTATAFSSTDTGVPLTPRAKALSMLQATLSLVTMAVIASRAINVLGD